MSSSASSDSTQTIINVVFGLTATIISVVTVWQGHRIWKMWCEHNHRNEGRSLAEVDPNSGDVELGLQPVHSTPTSLENSEHEEAAVPSALPPEHAGSVAEPEHISVPEQSTEPQSTPSTTVDVETGLGPSSAQGAPVEDDDLPNVDYGNAQPAMPNLKHGELLPAAIDNPHQAGVH